MSRKLYYEYIIFLIKRIANRPRFSTQDVKIGRGTYFGRNVRFNSKHVRIGDGVIFQDNVRIDATEFEIGDYGTIYFGCFFPGPGKLQIGHNFWLGNNSIIDSQGGTTIGNNVGIGAHSQLWTHMKYGDVVAGCRFDSVAPLNIGNDVWLVGHNLVSPVAIGNRSLAMLGSLITKDIPPDRVFAGSPAKDQTDKFGSQFSETDTEYRKAKLKGMIEKFARENTIRNVWNYVEICSELPQKWNAKKTIIDVSSRYYYKTGSRFELILMRYLLPEAKYVPVT
jgi:acetyltransferase-like isoleucine patch superfamily enzyme